MTKETPLSESEKFVSIVFADIIGSTEALSLTHSEIAHDYIQAQIDAMSSSVRKYGGEVIKTQGDGIIALFGHASNSESHALRATYAGITMSRECRRIGDPHPHVKYKGLRIGLHSGYALISHFDSAALAKTDTFGLAIHVASKLQVAAPTDHICLSSTTHALLTRFSPPKLYKSVSIGEGVTPISSYIIDTFSQAPADAPFKIGTSFNKIIGRETELSKIENLLDFSKFDMAKTVIILGEAGIGKTRIVDEVSNKLAAKGVTQMVLSGLDVMKETPFFVVRQILLSIELDEISLLEDEEREALEVLKSMDPLRMQNWRVPEYQKVATIYSGLLKVVKHKNRKYPVAIIAEDLHFFDEESLNFIVKLLAFLNVSNQAALICTSRMSLPKGLANKFTSSYSLKPLKAHQSKKLALSIASRFPGQTDEATIQAIISSSKGSPFAVTEFTKVELEHNQTSDSQIPLSLEPVIRSRIEGLSSAGRLLLNFICLIGKASNLDTLKALTHWDLPKIKDIVEACKSRDILIETSQGHYNFSHDLYRMACLNGLTALDKVDLHQKIYNYLNASADSKTTKTDIQLLARQAFGAGHTDEALEYFKLAFAEANGLGAISTVRNIFNQVNGFCDQIEDGAYHKARFAMLSFDSTHRLAEEQSLLPIYINALDQYEHKFSFNELIVIRSQLAIIYWTNGQSFKGLAFASDSMRAVKKTDHLGLEYIAVYTQACMEFSLGYLETAVNRISRHVKKMPEEIANKKWGQSVSIPSVVLQTFGAWFATDAGDIDLANKLLQAAMKTSEEYPNTYGSVLGQIAQGYILLRTKKYAQGGEVLCAAYEVASVSARSLAAMAAAWASLCMIETGDIEKAQNLLTREFASGRPDIIRNANRVYIYLARAKLEAAMGDYNNAENWIKQALSEGLSNGDLITTAYCYADYSKILALRNSPNPDRIRYLKNAMDLAEQCGMQLLMTECQTELESLDSS